MAPRGDPSTQDNDASDRELTTYSAASPLRLPHQFLRGLRRDLVVSRGLAWRLFLRDLRSQHRRSFFGYLWIVLPPLVTAAVWVFLDNRGVVSTAHGDVPYVLFVLIGTSLWQGFLDGLNVPFSKLDLAQGLLTKYKLPPEALVTTGILEVLFNQLVRMALLMVFYLVSGVSIPATIVFVPFGTLALVLLGIEIGSFLAPFGALYKDIPRAVQLATLALFFLTPIVYSSDGGLGTAINPVAVFLVTTRDWMLTGAGGMTPALVFWSLVVVVLLPATFAVYRLATPHLIDRAVG
jgi:lipopolysaccharide transport system permease protein